MNNHPSLQKVHEITLEAYRNRYQAVDYLPRLLKSLNIAEQLNDRPLIAQSHVAIALTYIHKGQPIDTLQHLNLATSIYDDLASREYDLWWVCLLHCLYGLTYDQLADYPKALSHQHQSLEIARRMNDENGIVRGLTNIGWLSLQMGNGDQAISYLTEATAYNEYVPTFTAIAHEHLGDAYYFMMHYERAKNSYIRSTEIAIDQDLLARTMARSASCCIQLEQYQEAEKLLESIEEIRVKLKRFAVYTETLYAMARAQLAIKYEQYDRASQICHSTMQLAQASQHTLATMLIKYQQAEILFANQKLDECREELLVLIENNIPFHLKVSTYRLLIDVYRVAGNWQLAIESLEEFNNIQLISQSKLLTVQQLLDSQRQEKELSQKNEELRELYQEKDELLQIVAHDLKNPLSAAHLNLQITLKNPETRSRDWIMQRLERVNRSVTNAFDIVSQLSTATLLESTTESDKAEPFTRVDLMNLIEAVVNEQVILAEQKQQQLLFVQPVPCLVHGNELWLWQMVSNLLSNAIKYSNPAAVTQVSMYKCWDGQGICLEIKDEGLGLNEVDLQGVFKKYNRLSSTPTGGESSTGLGLYIVKMMTEKMGGTISAESPGKDQGSTFYVKLPVLRGTEQEKSL